MQIETEELIDMPRVLSLREPWCWAILEAGKTIENRKLRWKYRGPLLLHSASGCTLEEYRAAVNWMLARRLIAHAGIVPHLTELPRGHIVGSCRFVGMLEADGTPCDAETRAALRETDRRWHMAGQHGYVVRDTKKLRTPIPLSAHLGLFRVPQSIHDAVARAA